MTILFGPRSARSGGPTMSGNPIETPNLSYAFRRIEVYPDGAMTGFVKSFGRVECATTICLTSPATTMMACWVSAFEPKPISAP